LEVHVLFRRSLPALGAALALAAIAAPALAITGGRLDGDGHPNVGLLVDGNRKPLCSGTLVSPTVFLTAGHCTASLATTRVAVTFDAEPALASTTLRPGTAVTDPGFGLDKKDSHDLAVVLLDEPVEGTQPAQLPAAGLLDRTPLKSASFTNVGYGATDRSNGGGERLVSTSGFGGLGATELKLHAKDGGVCFGDSGGPRFLGDSMLIVATTSGGNSACTGPSASYRLDTPSARAFLGRFVSLP
jgi:V8-like Glu-specific endopeptidase